MINIDAMIRKEIENGYGDANAQSKVCQDLILKAISTSNLNRKLSKCLSVYIFDDPSMRENDISGIYRRLSMVFKDRMYLTNLRSRDANWLGEDIDVVLNGILEFLDSCAD